MLSKQTPNAGSFFSYNPLSGADILLFPTDRPADMPRVFIIETVPGDNLRGYACGGRVEIERNPGSNQYEVRVNGKRTERFSVRYAPTKRRTKERFSRY